MRAPVEELRAECIRAGAFLASLRAGDWRRPTRCPPLDLHQVAAHALRGMSRVTEMIAAGAVDDQPEKDGATYFRYDAAALGPGVIQRAMEEAAGRFVVDGFAARWDAVTTEALDLAGRALSAGDPVLRSVFGLVSLSQYLRTRVVEVVVHTMDLRDAVGRDPEPDPGALDVACGVLAELLGTDPRVLGMDGVRFALVGTGRAQLDDVERKMLGPLTGRFPLIA